MAVGLKAAVFAACGHSGSCIWQALERRWLPIAGLGANAILQSALRANLITDAQHRSLRGLNVMRNLAVHRSQHEIDARKAQEFLSLAEAIKTVLEISYIV